MADNAATSMAHDLRPIGRAELQGRIEAVVMGAFGVWVLLTPWANGEFDNVVFRTYSINDLSSWTAPALFLVIGAELVSLARPGRTIYFVIAVLAFAVVVGAVIDVNYDNITDIDRVRGDMDELGVRSVVIILFFAHSVSSLVRGSLSADKLPSRS